MRFNRNHIGSAFDIFNHIPFTSLRIHTQQINSSIINCIKCFAFNFKVITFFFDNCRSQGQGLMKVCLQKSMIHV